MEIDFLTRFLDHAARHPQQIVLQTLQDSGRDSLTYAALLQAIKDVSHALHRAGVRPGDRVALLMENDHQWVVAFLGIAGLGAIAVPLDPAQTTGKITATLQHADCRLLFASSAFPTLLSAITLDLPNLTIWLKEDWPALIPSAPSSASWPIAHHAPDDDFVIVYTGGTTGTPKGVRLSLRALLICIQDTTKVFPLSPDDHILSILPLFHIMAIQASILAPLYKGCRVTYLLTKEPKRILAAFEEENPTAFLCVPLFYYQIRRRIFEEVARQPKARQTVFGLLLRLSGFLRRTFGWNAGRVLFKPLHRKFGTRLRGFGVGGARFDPIIAASMHDLGFPFFQGYGMTETAALATMTTLSITGGESCGRPLERLELDIVNPDNEGIGEIRMRGPQLMTGYWQEERATAEIMRDGWIYTGDLGRLTPDGRLLVTGRKKDVIVLSSGKNIFPEPLEQHYQSHCRLVAELCICSLADSSGVSEKLHAVIVPEHVELRARGIVNVREAILYELQSAGKLVATHERLHGFEIHNDPLPRTSARKLLRYRIIENLQTKQSAAPEPEPAPIPLSPTGQDIVDIIRRMKSIPAVTPSMDLELDLGFDSLERVELLAAVQDRLQCVITPEQAQSILTVEHLIAAAEKAAISAPAAAAKNQDSTWAGILNEPLTPEEQAIADQYLGPRPFSAPLLFILVKIFGLLAKLLLHYRFKAATPWPKDKAYVIAANHQSHLDVPLLVSSLPYHTFQRLCFLSTSRLHQNFFQVWFGRRARGIPIDPDRRLRTALRVAAEGLRRNHILCVFPEGHRSLDGKLLPFRKGLAILAVEQQIDVVPVGISGTGKVWGRGDKSIRLSPVSIETGLPLSPKGFSADDFNDRLFQAVASLVRDTL